MSPPPDTREQESSSVQRLGRGPMLKQAIQERVKVFITQHGLGAGDLLPPEGQLANDLGVSRGSVREAIKSLESLGIVEVRHGDGVRVREFNFDSILDFLSFGLVFQPSRAAEILQVREWLELAAIGEAAATITEAELDQIESLLVAWEKKAAAGEPTSAEDRGFHRMLYPSLGNASMLSLIDIFWVVYHALPAHAVADSNPQATAQAHREILDALRERNPMLARQRMSDHFRNIEQRIGAVTVPRRARQPSESGPRPKTKHATAP